MSNTSIGRGEKGSKFWMQTLVNIADDYLLKKIKSKLSTTSEITWLSPIKNMNYREFKTKEIEAFKNMDLSFWPDNGPWWDAVGVTDDGTVLLVEAKAHIRETITSCRATSDKSIELIKDGLMKTHKELASAGHLYDDYIWYSKYYQLANRLTFLSELSKQYKNVKLILLNIVNDPTHIKTSELEWQDHYNRVFEQLIGDSALPDNVIMIYFDKVEI